MIDTGDRLAIHELLGLYGHVIDERRWADMELVFTDDVVYDATDFGHGVTVSLEELRAHLGAEGVRVDRVGDRTTDPEQYVLHRGRRSIAVDLKHPAGLEVVLRLAEGAPVFLEGFRPGVAERLGVGPDDVHGRNPRA